MMMKFLVVRQYRHALFLMLLFAVNSIHSRPNGAASCEGGGPAFLPSTSHLITAGTPQGDSLESAGFQFVIRTSVLDPTVPTLLKKDTTYDMYVKGATAANTFKGFLARFDSGGAFSVTAVTNAKLATVCPSPVVGITHENRTPKTEAAFEFTAPDSGQTLIIDVTVVLNNNGNDGSQFLYSQYNFNITDEFPDSPTVELPQIPTPLPSEVPTMPPSEAPSMSPVMMTPAPGDSNATTPAPAGMVATNTSAPTPAPTPAPMSSPIAPIGVPTTDPPTPAPVPPTQMTPAPMVAPTTDRDTGSGSTVVVVSSFLTMMMLTGALLMMW